MISKDYLTSPQISILGFSITGLILSDFIIFFSSLKPVVSKYADIPNYMLLSLSSSQIFIFIILSMTAITCFKGFFTLVILRTSIRRFLLFFDLIIVHALEIFIGLFYILTNTQVLKKLENKICMIFSFFLILFWILLLLSLTVAFKKYSERKKKHDNGVTKPMRNSHKIIFIVSLFGLFLSAFTVYLFTAFWMRKCNMHKSKCPSGFASSYCDDNEVKEFDKLCSDKTSLHFIFAFGILQIFVFILIMIAGLRWKEDFFLKLIVTPSARYILIAIELSLYFAAIFIELYTFLRYTARKEDETLRIATLVFASLQGLFILIFVIGVACFLTDKSYKESFEKIKPVLVKNDIDI